jgi:hypothetical protein
MDFQIGDNVRFIDEPSQTGVVVRLHPLGVKKAVVVQMNSGPMYGEADKRAYFNTSVDALEKY